MKGRNLEQTETNSRNDARRNKQDNEKIIIKRQLTCGWEYEAKE